jgi:predicted O-methyltransferase YrrM
MEYEAVRDAVAGIPIMTPQQGRRIYDHVLATRPARVLELGTGNGVSAAYMAAALDAVGDGGRIVTVDHVGSARQHPADVTLGKAGLADLVTLVRIDASSYSWWLKGQVAASSDAHGNCDPVYDFCYLDGAHHWTIDGLAVYLVEKLLRPGGWLLLDDLDWSFVNPEYGQNPALPFLAMGPDERSEAHMRAVFDLIVMQHPSFTEFRIEDERWGWARKQPGEARRLTVAMTISPWASAMAAARRHVRRRRAARALS